MPLLSLSQWTERAWTTLFSAGTQEERSVPFDHRFDSLVAENTTFRVNGEMLTSHDDFRKLVIEHREQWYSAEISFNATMECLEDVSRGAQAGDVGTTFVVHCNHKENPQFELDIRVCAITTIAWEANKVGEDKRKIVALTMLYVEVPLLKSNESAAAAIHS